AGASRSPSRLVGPGGVLLRVLPREDRVPCLTSCVPLKERLPGGSEPGNLYRCTSAAGFGLFLGCGGRRSGCGISLLMSLGDEWFRVRHAAVACAAGDCVG